MKGGSMKKEDLFDCGVVIDSYGGGFIICDHGEMLGGANSQFGERYCGKSKSWSCQPIVNDPFATESEAIEAASMMIQEKEGR